MTVVAKLGSSIVAGEEGALRSDVLDSVCAQVAELHAGGENVVMVTSGAIARGMRMMELPARPSAIDELQAASAVGQGSLFRAYEERLAKGDVRAAQVLLTASDLQLRTHYLNARQTLQPAARLARRPGGERERHHRHRRDHLRRQRLPGGAGGDHARGAAAGPAHRPDGPLHEGPATPRRRRAGRRGDRRGPALRIRDRRAHLALRPRRDAQQGRGGRAWPGPPGSAP